MVNSFNDLHWTQCTNAWASSKYWCGYNLSCLNGLLKEGQILRFVPQSCIESQDSMWRFFFAIGFDSDNMFVALSSYYYNNFWGLCEFLLLESCSLARCSVKFWVAPSIFFLRHRIYSSALKARGRHGPCIFGFASGCSSISSYRYDSVKVFRLFSLRSICLSMTAAFGTCLFTDGISENASSANISLMADNFRARFSVSCVELLH